MKFVVVYFSKTGTTKEIALKIAKDLNCEAIEVVADKEYGSYFSAVLKSGAEFLLNKSISYKNEKPDLSTYDSIIVGFPIWYNKMPKVLESYLSDSNIQGKSLIPFCTSGGSTIKYSVTQLRKKFSNVKVQNEMNYPEIKDAEKYSAWLKRINSSNYLSQQD
ncbi:MAG: hypothetical protein K5765_06275 [Clostridia bacterium]|nr:hypothetical protein [Clostridia bacterium]